MAVNTGVAIKGGKVLIEGGKVNIAVVADGCQSCCKLYIYLVVVGGASGTSTVRARNIGDGSIAWDFSDADLDFNDFGQVSLNSSWCATENGVLVFSTLGADNIFLIDYDGVKVRSGDLVFTSTNKPGKAQVCADGNDGYLFGTDPGNSNDRTFMKFNMTTFANVNEDGSHNAITGYSVTHADRLLNVGEAAISSEKTLYVEGNRTLQKFDTAFAHQTEFTPIPDVTGAACGSPSLLAAQGADDGVGNVRRVVAGEGAVHWDGTGTNQRITVSDVCRWGCRYPLAAADYAIQNKTDEAIELFDVPSTSVNTWAWTNITGWAAGDDVRDLNVDKDGNFYFFYRDVSVEKWFFCRLDADFTTFNYKVEDTSVPLSGTFNARSWSPCINMKGQGRSAVSEETW